MIGRHRRLSLSRSFPSFLLFFWKVVVFLRIRKECRTHFPIRIPLTVIFHFLLNLNFPSTFDVASCTTVGLTACTFFILISVSLSWRWRQLPCCLSSVKTTTLHVCHLFDWLLYLFFPACVEAAALLRHFTHVFISVCLIYFHANPSQVIPHRLCTLYCPPHSLYWYLSLSLWASLSLSSPASLCFTDTSDKQTWRAQPSGWERVPVPRCVPCWASPCTGCCSSHGDSPAPGSNPLGPMLHTELIWWH